MESTAPSRTKNDGGLPDPKATIALPDDLFFTPPEIARLLKVSRAKAYQLVKSGEIKGITVGTQPRVPRANLLAYLRAISG